MKEKLQKKNKYLRVLRVLAKGFSAILLLLFLLILSLRTSYVQEKIVRWGVSYFSKKTEGQLSLGSFYLGFDGALMLGDLVIRDPQGDTLLSLQSLELFIHPKPLLKGNLQIRKLYLNGLAAKVIAEEEGKMNYDFLFAFAEEEQEESEEGNGVLDVLNIEVIKICDVRLDYLDKATGQEMYGHLGCFDMEPGVWDFVNWEFDMGNWTLSDSKIRWIEYGTEQEVDGKGEQPNALVEGDGLLPFCLGWRKSLIQNLSVSYRHLGDSEEWDVFLGEVMNSNAYWEGWSQGLGCDQMVFEEIALRHWDAKAKNNQRGKWDYSNMGVSSLRGNFDNLYFSEDSLSLRCLDFGFDERSGAQLVQVKGIFNLGKSNLSLQSLFFSTKHSRGNVEIEGDFPNWESMGSYDAKWKFSLKEGYFGPMDWSYFGEDLFPPGWNAIPIELKVAGQTQNKELQLRDLWAGQPNLWELSVSGGVLDFLSEEPQWDMKLDKGRVFRSALKYWIPNVDSLLQSDVLDEGLRVELATKGGVEKGRLEGGLNLGSLGFGWDFDWMHSNQWKGQFRLKGQDLEQVIRMDVDKIDCVLDTEGYYNGVEDYLYAAIFKMDTLLALGFELYNWGARVSGDKDSLLYEVDLVLEYFGARAKGRLDFGEQWQWEAEIGIGGSLNEYLGGDWDYLAHMSEWNWVGSWDPGFSLSMDLFANNSLRWAVEDGFYHTPPGYLSYFGGKDYSSFSSRLSFLEIDFGGNMSFEVLLDFAKREAKALWPDLEYQTQDSTLDEGLVELYIRFHPEEVLQEYFFSNLDFSDTLWIEFMADGESRHSFFHADAKQLGSDNFTLEEPKIWMELQEGAFSYGTSVKHIEINSFIFYDLLISGWLKEEVLVSEWELRDKQGLLSHFVGFSIAPEAQGFTVHIHPELFMVDFSTWELSEKNLIRWADHYLVIEDFSMRNEETQIFLYTDTADGFDNVYLKLVGLDMGRFSRAYGSEDKLLEGILKAELRGECIFDESQWYAMGDWEDAKYANYDLGNIHFCADYEDNIVKSLIRLDGENELFATGEVYPETGEWVQDIEVGRLNADLIEWMAPEQVEKANGYLRGRLTLGYSDASSGLHLKGGLQFREVSLYSKFLGVTLFMEEEKIRFDMEGIVFEEFIVQDEMGRPFSLNGRIATQDYSSFAYAVDLKAESFMLLNTEENKKDVFSGKFVFSADLNIRGDNQLPKVTGEIKIEESTKVSVVMPEQAADIIERESVVLFVDSVSLALRQQIIEDRDTLVRSTSFGGMELRLRLRSDERAVVTLYIDPIAGDYLVISGKSLVNIGISKSGEISLNGRFEVTEGYYQLSMFDIVKKRFTLVPGSKLSWAGDPYAVDLGITARYEVRSPPLDLVSERLVGMSPDQINAYRQDLPFWVDMLIKGSLSSPDISFALDMPENRRGALDGVVYSRLQEINQIENEVNKQAFGLIVFNRFLSGWTPGGEGGGEAMARSSASRIISQQMNNMADRLVKGVDLNFQLDSHGAMGEGMTGARTQLNVEVQKRFLEDRLIFQVGSNIDIEGRPEAESGSASEWVGDIVAEYLVTPDGRYRLKAFRKNQFEGLVDGQVINTGVSFVFVRQQDTREIREKKRILGIRTEEKNPTIMRSGNEN